MITQSSLSLLRPSEIACWPCSILLIMFRNTDRLSSCSIRNGVLALQHTPYHVHEHRQIILLSYQKLRAGPAAYSLSCSGTQTDYPLFSIRNGVLALLRRVFRGDCQSYKPRSCHQVGHVWLCEFLCETLCSCGRARECMYAAAFLCVVLAVAVAVAVAVAAWLFLVRVHVCSVYRSPPPFLPIHNKSMKLAVIYT